MGSVTGQAYRFERARVIRDVGSDKSFFVKTVKDSFKGNKQQIVQGLRQDRCQDIHYSVSGKVGLIE